jgi:hypothetical protein
MQLLNPEDKKFFFRTLQIDGKCSSQLRFFTFVMTASFEIAFKIVSHIPMF